MAFDLQVQHILNELVMGGMVLETNMTEILLRIEEQNKIEKEEVSKNKTSHEMKKKIFERHFPLFSTILFSSSPMYLSMMEAYPCVLACGLVLLIVINALLCGVW